MTAVSLYYAKLFNSYFVRAKGLEPPPPKGPGPKPGASANSATPAWFARAYSRLLRGSAVRKQVRATLPLR